MRRIGMNPARDQVISYKPQRVTVAVLTYIPMLEGYFTERLDILKLCLHSIRQNTEVPFDLLVFNNGSCAEVSDYLEELRSEGIIRYLMSSGQNIGKSGAFKMIFGSAPGEIVAYCDDDVFHYPGWLEDQLEILDHFPGVGMVSGVGIRVRFRDSIGSNLDFAEKNPEARLEYGHFIPEVWERDFCLSTGRNFEEYAKDTADMQDIRLHYRGKAAYAMANHFQFLAPREVIQNALKPEWSGRLMREMAALDQAVEKMGRLRLSTLERKVRHMGNALPEDLSGVDEAFRFASKRKLQDQSRNLWRRALLRLPGMGGLLRFLYHQIFLILNVGSLRSKQDRSGLPRNGDQ